MTEAERISFMQNRESSSKIDFDSEINSKNERQKAIAKEIAEMEKQLKKIKEDLNNQNDLALIEKTMSFKKMYEVSLDKLNAEREAITRSVVELERLKDASNIQSKIDILRERERLVEEKRLADKEAIEAKELSNQKARIAMKKNSILEEFDKMLSETTYATKLEKFKQRADEGYEKKKTGKELSMLDDKRKGGNPEQKVVDYKEKPKVLWTGDLSQDEMDIEPAILPESQVITEKTEKQTVVPIKTEKQTAAPIIPTKVRPEIADESVLRYDEREGYNEDAPDAIQETVTEYKVKKGDTLSTIARKAKTNIPAILDLNPSIKNKNLIAIGKRIQIQIVGTPKYINEIKSKLEK